MSALAANITGLDLNRLAEELGAGLRPPLAVWQSFGIVTRKDAEAVLGLGVFQEMLHEAHIRWHTKTNLRERIKAKTLVGMEQFLPDMFDDAMDPARPLHHRVQMWKFLGALAGLDAEASAAGGMAAIGGGVSITIDLSGGGPGAEDPKVVVIRGTGDDLGVDEGGIDGEGPLQIRDEGEAEEAEDADTWGGEVDDTPAVTEDDEDWSIELAELTEAMVGVGDEE